MSEIWQRCAISNAKEMEASQVRRWPWRWWTRRQTEEFISMLIGRTPTEAEKCAALPLRGATFERKWSRRNAETGGAWRETHKKNFQEARYRVSSLPLTRLLTDADRHRFLIAWLIIIGPGHAHWQHFHHFNKQIIFFVCPFNCCPEIEHVKRYIWMKFA